MTKQEIKTLNHNTPPIPRFFFSPPTFPLREKAPWRRLGLAGAWVLLAFLHLGAAGAAWGQDAVGLKIGTIDFQQVLGESQAGKRSSRILNASKEQKEAELKAVGLELQKEFKELSSNILLTDEARAEKRQALEKREIDWKATYRQSEDELQQAQIKASQVIYADMQTVIRQLAEAEGFDFVLEKSLMQAVLFSKHKVEDITKKAIERYDGLSK